MKTLAKGHKSHKSNLHVLSHSSTSETNRPQDEQAVKNAARGKTRGGESSRAQSPAVISESASRRKSRSSLLRWATGRFHTFHTSSASSRWARVVHGSWKAAFIYPQTQRGLGLSPNAERRRTFQNVHLLETLFKTGGVSIFTSGFMLRRASCLWAIIQSKFL